MARRITSSTFVTLDGVMQAPGGKEEDVDNGFEHGGWSVGYFDEAVGEAMTEYMAEPFDLLLGRKTYDIFAAYWPTQEVADEDTEIANPLNAATKYVVSTTLASVEWGPGVLIDDNVVERIREIKAGDGPDLQVHGSSGLLQTLLANGLLDYMQLVISPVVLGAGKRLFGSGTIPTGFKLLESRVTPSGVTILRLELGEEIKYGQMGN